MSETQKPETHLTITSAADVGWVVSRAGSYGDITMILGAFEDLGRALDFMRKAMCPAYSLVPQTESHDQSRYQRINAQRHVDWGAL